MIYKKTNLKRVMSIVLAVLICITSIQFENLHTVKGEEFGIETIEDFSKYKVEITSGVLYQDEDANDGKYWTNAEDIKIQNPDESLKLSYFYQYDKDEEPSNAINLETSISFEEHDNIFVWAKLGEDFYTPISIYRDIDAPSLNGEIKALDENKKVTDILEITGEDNEIVEYVMYTNLEKISFQVKDNENGSGIKNILTNSSNDINTATELSSYSVENEWT